MNTSASYTLDNIAGALAERGFARRGAFHPEPDDNVLALPDGAPALTVCLLGRTGGEQWPAFARSPEARDGFPDPLNRWSKQAIESIAVPLDAAALYRFGGPPWHDFQRWVLKAEGGLSLAAGFAHSPEVGTLALVSRGARPARAVQTCAPRERKSVRSLPRPAVPFGLPGLRFRAGVPLRPRRVPSLYRNRRRGLPDPSLPLLTYILCRHLVPRGFK